ncbi:AMP-binding protein [Streptomyces zaomyceticus]|uniref:AMP-binding protein n=1 Tax=Streptomyces zaomyceticus TaxID=68286 RepID=UPI0036C7880F
MTAAPAGQSADFETVATESGDTAVIPYTSGTTGRPKGAELTHSNVMLNVPTCHKLIGEIEHDVHLITLPLFHSFGQVDQMNAGIASRATLVLLPRFAARSALALMQRHAVTFAWPSDSTARRAARMLSPAVVIDPGSRHRSVPAWRMIRSPDVCDSRNGADER